MTALRGVDDSLTSHDTPGCSCNTTIRALAALAIPTEPRQHLLAHSPGNWTLMKRAIHILFWLSLVTAVLVFLLRRGGNHEAPTEKEPPPAAGALPVPAFVRTPPPVFVMPDASSPTPAETETAAEAALMKQIRENWRSNPAKTVELAREARQRFGDSRDSDERDSLLVQGYINLHDMDAARAEMPYYYKHHPHGRWGDYLFALTNVGPGSP